MPMLGMVNIHRLIISAKYSLAFNFWIVFTLSTNPRPLPKQTDHMLLGRHITKFNRTWVHTRTSSVKTISKTTCLGFRFYLVTLTNPKLTVLLHSAPSNNVAFRSFDEAMPGRRQTHGLDGVGLGGRDGEFHQGHIKVHGAAIESRMRDDPLRWNNQSTHSRPND